MNKQNEIITPEHENHFPSTEHGAADLKPSEAVELHEVTGNIYSDKGEGYIAVQARDDLKGKPKDAEILQAHNIGLEQSAVADSEDGKTFQEILEDGKPLKNPQAFLNRVLNREGKTE